MEVNKLAKICTKCGNKIPWFIVENNVRIRITGRKLCFACSPRRHYSHVADSWAKMPYQQRKRLVTDKLGGKCVECGWHTYPSLFHFHHLKRSKKNKSVPRLIKESTWARVNAEIRRCILVCPNCHAAIHANLILHRFLVK